MKVATMAMLVSLGILPTSVSLTFASEAKRNILGFHPGMSYIEATNLAAKVCKDKLARPSWDDGDGSTTLFLTCSLGTRQVIAGLTDDGERLGFRFGNALPAQRLISISYHFAKPQPDVDLYRYAAERFSVPVGCFIAHACPLSPPGLYFSFVEGKTISTSFLLLIDIQLFRDNDKRWKQEHSPTKIGAGGEEGQNLENSIVIFPPAAESTSGPKDIRKRHTVSPADRETPRADFQDSVPSVPMIIREERR
jgi:hypothetical protein